MCDLTAKLTVRDRKQFWLALQRLDDLLVATTHGELPNISQDYEAHVGTPPTSALTRLTLTPNDSRLSAMS